MQLKTKIIAHSSPALLKKIANSFDHEFQLLEPESSLSVNILPTLKYSLMSSIITAPSQGQPHIECVIASNLALDMSCMQQLLSELPCEWKCELVEYDIKSGKKIYFQQFAQDTLLSSSIRPEQDVNNVSIHSIKINYSNGSIKNIYFLPPGLKEDLLPSSSTHQMLKIVSSLRVYLSLQEYPNYQVMFQDDFSEHLNNFIYEQSANKITIIVNIRQEQPLDYKLIQQAGQLKEPESWRQKPQYRQIKKSIHELKLKEHGLKQQAKNMKKEVTNIINQLQKLIGLPQLKYSEITIEQIHKLKAQCFTEKVNKINEKDHLLQAMKIRLQELQSRKNELLNHRQDTQNQQISELLLLKTSVISLQASQNVRPKTTQGHIYKRDKPQINKQLMTTIFSRVQKAKGIGNLTSVSIPRSDVKTTSRPQPEQPKQVQKSFKKVEKKVAAVVKDGLSGNVQLDIPKLRDEFDMEKMEVDFEIEKYLQHKKQEFLEATDILHKIMEGTDEVRFFSAQD